MSELAEKMIDDAAKIIDAKIREYWTTENPGEPGYDDMSRAVLAQALRTLEQQTGGKIMNSFTPQCLANLASQIEDIA